MSNKPIQSIESSQNLIHIKRSEGHIQQAKIIQYYPPNSFVLVQWNENEKIKVKEINFEDLIKHNPNFQLKSLCYISIYLF